jgi:hypothetical protein
VGSNGFGFAWVSPISNLPQAEHFYRRRIRQQIHEAEGARLLEDGMGSDPGVCAARAPILITHTDLFDPGFRVQDRPACSSAR